MLEIVVTILHAYKKNDALEAHYQESASKHTTKIIVLSILCEKKMNDSDNGPSFMRHTHLIHSSFLFFIIRRRSQRRPHTHKKE